MADTVWLGLAGVIIEDANALDYYATKVGGAPVYPGQIVPAAAVTGLRCSVCGSDLTLVLQAYAPHPDAPDRVSLVFGCTKLGCGKSAGCWRALRCQLQSAQQTKAVESSEQSTSKQESPPPPSAVAAAADASKAAGDWGDARDWAAAAAPAAAAAAAVDDPWAAAAGSDFNTGIPTVTTLSACNAFDFSDLTSTLAAAGQQAAAAAANTQKSKQHDDATAAATAAAAVCCRGATGPALPEFYLYAEAEPGEAAAKAISNKEFQHLQQLITEYEAQESVTAAGTSAATTNQTSSSSSSKSATAASSSAAPAAAGSSEDGVSWAGEVYEKDELRGVERGYLKFSKRLARQPEQCARYCYQGQVLWPKTQQPQPSPCSRCGGPRVFELQLMPALIQMTIEAGQMMQEQGMHVDHQVIDAVANWDWCTVAVFSCQASCSSRSQIVGSASPRGQQCDACFEEVIMINEQDCHIALPPPVGGMPGNPAGPSTSAPASGVSCGADQADSVDASDTDDAVVVSR